MGMCGLGGIWNTIFPRDTHNLEQSTVGVGGGLRSCPSLNPMLESNSSASTSLGKRNLTQFDVFINHRGPDLKKTFVSHLDAALRRAGRDPFLDAKSLVEGHHAFNSINDALIGVLVHVAIFSPGYAESKYCLNELCDMLGSKKPLIPVFYNVEPENLCWIEGGPFAEAFSHHLERGRDQDVKRWKQALLEAASITGFRLVDSDNDSKLVEKVVAAVLKALPPPPPLPPARYSVGLKETSAHVVNMLHKMGDNVGVMGICGMGGIGKTTLAKEVYNQEQSNFENWCFLKNVKDAKGTAIMDLQMKMVVDLLGKDARKMVGGYARWIEMIQKKKVLIVVDDISNMEQFYELIPNLKQLAPGSRVLITSRESDILKNIMSDVPQPQQALYPMPELNFSKSLELFIWWAFKKKNLYDVDVVFHDNVEKITKACGGVPLALEVMGGFLADKKDIPECWIEALFALRKNGDIIKRLEISYNGLVNDDDRHMFVDIACFMLGHPKQVALEVWNTIGNYDSPNWSLNRLIDKCLVKVDVEGLLSMHDLLRDMGRNIVIQRTLLKPGTQSHIWDSFILVKILKKIQVQDLNEVLSVSIVGQKDGIVCNAKQYARMKKLRYLLLDECLVNGDFSGWSEELRWLQWRYFPHEELPSNMELPNLVVLDLANSHHLTRVWARDFELECLWEELRMLILRKCKNLEELPQHINKLVKLKFLNLEGCSALKSLPASLEGLTELENLNLAGCFKLTILPNFGCLRRLQQFNLSNTWNWTKLPESFGNLSNMKKLWLNRCGYLQKLPRSFCKLTKLTHLCLGETALEDLPEDFGELHNLQVAYFSRCKSLIGLPESFGNLSNIEKLRLNGCELFRKLPPSFCKLTKLTNLWLDETALEELPEHIGELHNLQEAYFSGCKSLIGVPESFGNLSNMEKLWLNGCVLLRKLPPSFCKLTKLTHLSLAETTLEELPEDFGKLHNLQEAYFSHCKSLIGLPESFGNLSNMEKLWLNGCVLLRKLPPSFCKLTKLTILWLSKTALEELPEDFGELHNLQDAYFSGCESLIGLPESFGNLSNMEKLWLNGCVLLRKLLPSFCKLTKLTILWLSKTALEELPEDFGKLHNLQDAYFSGCESLIGLPESFGNLSNMEKLWLNGCVLLRKLPPSFCKLKKLIVLWLSTTALEELPEDFGELHNLQEAYFSRCKSLIGLPESFGNLSNIEKLRLNGCELLRKLPLSFCNLTKLKVLWLNKTALEELPEHIGELHNLQEAYFSGCKSLIGLPESFGNLSNMEKLWLNGCVLLRKLPPSFCKLTKLTHLWLGETALEERGLWQTSQPARGLFF